MQGRIKIDADKDLEMGDHIFIIITEPIVYEHHGIYIGDGKVIHFANMIVECSLVNFSHGLVVRIAK
jgi:cell wall-associated NlpC family hydrolase